MANKLKELARQEDGFLGIESARNDIGITVSYWKDLSAVRKWKAQSDHLFAQKMGRKRWYKQYTTRIAFVERDYNFEY